MAKRTVTVSLARPLRKDDWRNARYQVVDTREVTFEQGSHPLNVLGDAFVRYLNPRNLFGRFAQLVALLDQPTKVEFEEFLGTCCSWVLVVHPRAFKPTFRKAVRDVGGTDWSKLPAGFEYP